MRNKPLFVAGAVFYHIGLVKGLMIWGSEHGAAEISGFGILNLWPQGRI